MAAVHLITLPPSYTFKLPRTARTISRSPRMAFQPVRSIVNGVVDKIVEPIPRRSANYKPSSWNDDHIQSLKTDDDMGRIHHVKRIEELKKDVIRCMIDEEKEELVDQLKLVDDLQQLGVSYHFEKEIKQTLGTIYDSMKNTSMAVKDDLYATSLLFRLLREHGFYASQDVFLNFKDDDDNFLSSLLHDTRAMLSLYEASYHAMEGEQILHDARDFLTNHLAQMLNGNMCNSTLKEHVTHALELPLNWRMARLHSHWFIKKYAERNDMKPALLELAMLDFNMVQCTYRKELKEKWRWWSNLDLLGDELSFARDRLVESYLWSVGWSFEPKLDSCRDTLTEVISFVTIIDDVYDVYGSLDESELFTDAVERWDVNAIEQLPDYMKTCFLALFNTTNTRGYYIFKSKGVDAIPCLKKSWADLCKCYMKEARWYHSGYMPTLEEYLDNAWFSISGPVLLVHGFFCVSENISTDVLDCLMNHSDIVRQSSMIFRLCDDLQTSKAELERGDTPKSIQCYMHDKGVSEAAARNHIRGMISDIWEKLNRNRFDRSVFDEPFIALAMNVARTAQWIYQYEDGYGESGDLTKDHVRSVIIEPVSLREM